MPACEMRFEIGSIQPVACCGDQQIQEADAAVAGVDVLAEPDDQQGEIAARQRRAQVGQSTASGGDGALRVGGEVATHTRRR